MGEEKVAQRFEGAHPNFRFFPYIQSLGLRCFWLGGWNVGANPSIDFRERTRSMPQPEKDPKACCENLKPDDVMFFQVQIPLFK